MYVCCVCALNRYLYDCFYHQYSLLSCFLFVKLLEMLLHVAQHCSQKAEYVGSIWKYCALYYIYLSILWMIGLQNEKTSYLLICQQNGQTLSHTIRNYWPGIIWRTSIIEKNVLHTTLHHMTLHYMTLHCTTLRHTTLHYATLHYATPHYTTLRYTALHHTALPYTILIHPYPFLSSSAWERVRPWMLPHELAYRGWGGVPRGFRPVHQQSES